MHVEFLENLFNAPRQCCGYWLGPFSAAHYVALDMAKSPLLQADGKLAPVDLVLAAKICAAPIVLENGAYVPRRTNRIRASLRDWWWSRKLSKRPGLFRFEARKWQCHYDDHCARMMQMTREGVAETLTAPFIGALVVKGMQIGLTEARAWSMPLGLLSTLAEIADEMAGGGVRFLDQDEMEQWEEAQAFADATGEKLRAAGQIPEPEELIYN